MTRTFFFEWSGPKKTNFREGVFEHIPQLSVNKIHIFLYFLCLHVMSLFIDMKMILSLKWLRFTV